MAKSKKKDKPSTNKRTAPKSPVKKKTASPARKPARKPLRKSTRKPVRKLAHKAARKAARKSPVKKKAAVKKPAAKKPVAKKLAPEAKPIGGLPGQLYAAAIKILKDRQAEEIVTVNLAGRSAMADYLIIASGRASRQIVAIADYLRTAFQELGVRQVRVEGLPQGNWVLVDAGDIVVHLFRPDVRRYYGLDKIWGK